MAEDTAVSSSSGKLFYVVPWAVRMFLQGTCYRKDPSLCFLSSFSPQHSSIQELGMSLWSSTLPFHDFSLAGVQSSSPAASHKLTQIRAWTAHCWPVPALCQQTIISPWNPSTPYGRRRGLNKGTIISKKHKKRDQSLPRVKIRIPEPSQRIL